jgi:hypothetical protein
MNTYATESHISTCFSRQINDTCSSQRQETITYSSSTLLQHLRFPTLLSQDLLSIILANSAHDQENPRNKTHMFSLIFEILHFLCQPLFLWITGSSPVLESLSSHHTKYSLSDYQSAHVPVCGVRLTGLLGVECGFDVG